VVERAVILSGDRVLRLPLNELVHSSESAAMNPEKTLEEAEREHILQALTRANWVIGGPNGAAARLGLKRTTLRYKMDRLGIGSRFPVVVNRRSRVLSLEAVLGMIDAL
jgi:formate hydrogenlyase transcriptional activator